MSTRVMLTAVAVSLALGFSGIAGAAFDFTTIDVPGAALTVVTGINAFGRLSGTYHAATDPINIDHAFFWNNGAVTTLDPPGAIASQAGHINGHDDVVGNYSDSNSQGHGFIWTKGAFTTVDFPDATGTVVIGINDLGEVVG